MYVGNLPLKSLVLYALLNLNNFDEIIIEARGKQIEKLLTLIELLRRITKDKIEVELKYGYLEKDVNNNKLLLNKYITPVLEAKIRVKNR
jgi:DNA-binding protein Alba